MELESSAGLRLELRDRAQTELEGSGNAWSISRGRAWGCRSRDDGANPSGGRKGQCSALRRQCMRHFQRKSRMVEISKYGSEGAPGAQAPGATRP